MKTSAEKILTIQDISDVLNKHQDTLREYNVIRLGLFGSYIRGEQKKDSDIDFLVEFDLTAFGPNFKGLFDTFMDLVSYLEDLFGKKVDLITKGNLSPYIKPYIEKEVKWYEI